MAYEETPGMPREPFHYCTYFDQHYLTRGLALYRSLEAHSRPFRLWVLCMDEVVYAILKQLALPEIEPIALAAFEQGDEALLEAKQQRSLIEYYFTCTPSLPLYILTHQPEVERITYLDADLFFFSDPAPLFAEVGERSIAIIGHRFPADLRHRERAGIYNVGWLSFRRDEHGLGCLHWWRARCLEWCYDREEPERFADQKYLDDWPERFQNVLVVRHPGANLAPWNLRNYQLTQGADGSTYVDGEPLIFFHFHGLKRVNRWLYIHGLGNYRTQSSLLLRQAIYRPYVQLLTSIPHDLAVIAVEQVRSVGTIRYTKLPVVVQQCQMRWLLRWLRTMASTGKGLLSGAYIFVG